MILLFLFVLQAHAMTVQEISEQVNKYESAREIYQEKAAVAVEVRANPEATKEQKDAADAVVLQKQAELDNLGKEEIKLEETKEAVSK